MDARLPLTSGTVNTRSMLLTCYGAFIRDLDGWVAVRDLVTLFADLGIESGALRAALTRLKAGGTVVPEKQGGRPGYRLSFASEALVIEGEERLHGHLVPARVEDGWVLAVFSIPESRREQRTLLTSRLEWLGYGLMAPGVRIAPAAQLPETSATLRRLGLTDHVHLMRATYEEFQRPEELVRQWWDLDAIAEGYTDFLAEAQPVLQRWESSSTVDPREAFADYVRVRTLWRRLPYLDPGLPDELYPGQWPRSRATGVFLHIDRLLRKPALEHVQAVTGHTGPTPAPRTP
ncbi:PaaX family transcriptional regulator C-terminal domain-containing protein [Streptomyces sp. NPDC050145]|uniref:PaaX family transcriptional regulator n=1 Tax=Streptomyces sp. NPDC050145 TaxID=3365602 RepID=UPI0037AFC257